MSEDSELLKVADFATKMQCTPRFVRNLAARGTIRVVRLGKRFVRVPAGELKRLADAGQNVGPK